MSVNFTYSESQSGIRGNGQLTKFFNPVMDITIKGRNTSRVHHYEDGRVVELGLRILKNLPEAHHCNENCDIEVAIYFVTPGEAERFAPVFKQNVRPQTCDRHNCIPSIHQNYLTCSKQGALRTLDGILKSSKEFEDKANEWYEKAKDFIEKATPRKECFVDALNPNLERVIRATFKDQPGAINLLEDLKQKPFGRGVEKILNRLVNGVYGDFSSETLPQIQLAFDLELWGFNDLIGHVNQGRYEHEGPNAKKNISDLLTRVAGHLAEK